MPADIWGLGNICIELLAVLAQKKATADSSKLGTTGSQEEEAMCALEELASSMVQAEQYLRPDIQ